MSKRQYAAPSPSPRLFSILFDVARYEYQRPSPSRSTLVTSTTVRVAEVTASRALSADTSTSAAYNTATLAELHQLQKSD
jgi:hypothetical protein